MTIVITGTVKEVSENVKTINFPNGEVQMTSFSVELDDHTQIPIEAWGQRKIDFAKANVGRKADCVCSIVGTRSNFTNRDGEDAEISYCRLKLKTMVLEWEG